MMPALKILLSAYCHSNRKGNRWSLSARRLAVSPSTWAFTSCCDSPRAILTRCHGFLCPRTVCLWGPEVLVRRAASLHFQFYCSFGWRSITFSVECCAVSECSAPEVDVSLGTGPLLTNDTIITYTQAFGHRIRVEPIDVLENDKFLWYPTPFLSVFNENLELPAFFLFLCFVFILIQTSHYLPEIPVYLSWISYSSLIFRLNARSEW